MNKLSFFFCLVFVFCCCSSEKGGVSDDNKYTVSSKKGLYLRDLPEKEGRIICLIPGGEEITVNDKTEKSDKIDDIDSPWYYVNYKSYKGWVFGGYIHKSKNNEKIVLSQSSFGNIKIGDSFDKVVEDIKPDSVKVSPDGTWVLFKNNERILRLCDKNDGKDKIVVWVEIYSDYFELPGGIRVGSTISELLAKYPCKEIGYDEVVGSAFFNITAFSEFKKNFGSVIVFVKPNDANKPIITEKKVEYIKTGKSSKFNKNGKVYFFYLHK